MLVGELEGLKTVILHVFTLFLYSSVSQVQIPQSFPPDLHEPEGLLDVPADGEVVDGDLPQLALLVDHEQTAERDPGILLK